MLFHRLLGLVGGGVGEVARLGGLTLPRVLLGVLLGLPDEALDLVLGESGARGNRDALRLGGGLVRRGDVEDAVGVYVERNVDLRDAARSGGDAVEREPADGLVLVGHAPLALEDVNLDAGLTVRGGREHFGARGGDGGVALDEMGCHAAERLDAERERRNVEEEDILDLALEHACLDSRADGDDLVGVDALVRLFG